MGGAIILVRRFVPALLVAALVGGLIAAVPVGADSRTGSGAPAPQAAATYRVALEAGSGANGAAARTFTVAVGKSTDGGESYAAAPGETVTFALVGEGAVVAIAPGSVNGLTCTTSADGRCTITTESPSPEDSTLTAMVGAASASISLAAA